MKARLTIEQHQDLAARLRRIDEECDAVAEMILKDRSRVYMIKRMIRACHHLGKLKSDLENDLIKAHQHAAPGEVLLKIYYPDPE
jgi:hypothetical protein